MFNINTSRTKEFQAKQEEDSNEHNMLLPKLKYTTTSTQWSGLKNHPRIVRVSKAFGGKDRHSKVCTVKGLRDRRIRLSVPTAIQLYELQDKLGLSQPSKVIDWLLDSTKDDIDQLPPLQMLLGGFNQFHSLPAALINPQDLNSAQLSLSQLFTTTPNGTKDHDIDGDRRRKKGKETLVENKSSSYQHENGGLNFFPIPQYSYPGLFPYNPYSNWEPTCSNVSISQFRNQGLTDNSSMASQLLLGPPSTASTPSANFPAFIMPNLGENHGHLARQNNYFHLLSSGSQHVPPNSLMPLFNLSDSQEKVPFGLDAHNKNHK